jgi:hypothetical protein
MCMKRMATVTLVALAAILCVQGPHAQDDPSKWLIGGWEGSIQNYSPREGPGRIMVVMAIAPDGTVQGMWGATGGGLGKAEIRLTETRVRLVTSAGSIVELTRVGEDRLEGSFTLKTGSTFALTLTKQKPSREAEFSILADGVYLTKEEAGPEGVRPGPNGAYQLKTGPFYRFQVKTPVRAGIERAIIKEMVLKVVASGGINTTNEERYKTSGLAYLVWMSHGWRPAAREIIDIRGAVSLRVELWAYDQEGRESNHIILPIVLQ